MHVAGETETALDIFVDFGGVNVNVDKFFCARVFSYVAGLPVAETRADRDNQIRRRDRMISRLLAVHAREAQILRMRARDGSNAHERVDDGQIKFLDERDNFLGRARRNCSAAHDYHRSLRFGNFISRLRRADYKIGVGLRGNFFFDFLRAIIHLREK